MKAVAPGKLILSGEHAVVHGAPALAMAIDRNAQTVVTPAEGESVSFSIQGLEPGESYTLRALQDFRDRVKHNYDLFLAGKLGIRDVMAKPVDLFKYGYILALDALHHKIDEGVCMKIRSNIPMGCGLGSSAATVLSELRAIGHYLRVDFKPQWYYDFSLEVEKMQHGHPSGVDSYISLNGGCARFQNGEAVSVPLPQLQMFLVETGAPECTTGECVVQVDKEFGRSSIWSEFAHVTMGMEGGIVKNDVELVRALIRENHSLLSKIGVVPEPVQQFVREVEAAGGAAKICGAGAIRGDAGGVVLVLADQMPVQLCEKYGYTVSPVRGDPLGTRIV
ncbi:mevalonate kinase [Verrucomicrobiota bacterium]